MPIFDLYKPFEVVVVPFPFSDRLAEKRRPAVVVSSADFSASHGVVWLAMITSSLHRQSDGDVEIRNLALAGLRAPSMVRVAKIASLEPSRIVRSIGKLNRTDGASVVSAIRNALA